MNPLFCVMDCMGTVPAPQDPLEQILLLGTVLGPRYSHCPIPEELPKVQSLGIPSAKSQLAIGEPKTCPVIFWTNRIKKNILISFFKFHLICLSKIQNSIHRITIFNVIIQCSRLIISVKTRIFIWLGNVLLSLHLLEF